MSDSAFFEADGAAALADAGTLRRVRFAVQADEGHAVLMEFAAPFPCMALVASSPVQDPLPEPPAPPRDGIDVLAVPLSPAEHPSLGQALSQWVGRSAGASMAAPIGSVVHGVQLIWGIDRAAILAAPERLEPVLKALVEFCHYENELRKLEREVGGAWLELQADMPLSFEVAPIDLERRDEIGRRMTQTLHRRMRHARIQPHLNRAAASLSLQAQEMGQRLREKTRVEERHETLDGQLAAFERVYEMASQRISDCRASRDERKLEWVIIVLLAAEVLLLLAELLKRLES